MHLQLDNAFYFEGLRDTQYSQLQSDSKTAVFPGHQWCKQENLDLHSAANTCS